MLIPITNTPRDYSWGSPDLIATLEGRVPTGTPEAEVWYGAHPGCPSIVADGSGRTLDAALELAGEPPLPFLMKLLAAGSSLSIQAHPTKAQAVQGFAREEASGLARDAGDRLYRDDNHKPEIIVAVSDEFRALVGVRPLADTRRLLAALGGGAAATALAARLEGADDEAIVRSTLAWALADADAQFVADLAGALDSADNEEFADEIVTLRAAAADFPGDPGLIVALLMNLVVLRRGDALFAPAGVLHAYQSGLGVELMAASDNVLRGGLTPKHVDVPELMRVVDVSAGPAPLVAPRIVGDGVSEFAPAVPDFALTHAVVGPGAPVRVALRGAAIVLVVTGSVAVRTRGGDLAQLAPGAAAYVGAGEREVEVTGEGEAFIAQPGAI